MIDLSLYPKAHQMLRKRYEHSYHQGWQYLFPRDELTSHKVEGDKPVSRQMVYHVCCQYDKGCFCRFCLYGAR